MKLFKKTIFLFLAILPMIPFFQLAVTSIGNDTATQIIAPPTKVYIAENYVQYDVSQGDESLMTQCAQLILPPYDRVDAPYQAGSVLYSVVGLAVHIESAFLGNVSPHSMYTDYMIVAFGLIVYYFYIVLLMSLADILTFVPRKCAEIFGGKL